MVRGPGTQRPHQIGYSIVSRNYGTERGNLLPFFSVFQMSGIQSFLTLEVDMVIDRRCQPAYGAFDSLMRYSRERCQGGFGSP